MKRDKKQDKNYDKKEDKIEGVFLGEKIANMSPKVVSAVKSETSTFVVGMLLAMFGVYLLLAFTSFLFNGGGDQSLLAHPNPGELLETDNDVQNQTGPLGARMAEFLMNDCFGIPAYLIGVFFIIAGLKLMKAYEFKVRKWFFACSIAMIWCSLTFGFALNGLFEDSFIYPGGLHGYNISAWIASQIGIPGLIMVLLAIAIVYGIAISRSTMNVTRKVLHPPFFNRKNKKNDEYESIAAESQINETLEESLVKAETCHPEVDDIVRIDEEEMDVDDDEVDDHTEEDNSIELDLNAPALTPSSVSTPVQKTVAQTVNTEETVVEPTFEISDEKHEDDEEFRGKMTQPYNPRLDLEHYKFPTLDLLSKYEDKSGSIDMDEQNANKDRIIQVLRSFGIEISSIKASVGPTITLYEITPAEGIRISKIRNLEDDIALSLSALGIRIIAPIPGKGTVGIEVPNANPHIVPMSSVLASKKFQETKFELPVVLGKTITNEVFMVDLAKAPHMLVAGATGQGKSVGLNAIVTSLLYKKHPSELKFVIIDPKKVEFAIYAPIERHFLAKLPDGDDAIITDVTKVVQTLNSLCVEMDTRYDLLRKAGCRNIKEYNAKFINRQLNPENGHRFMPYIVIIIDEFGDLIMTAGKEVELPICRIAQLARAVGIHAIIATQRPTTNIITGTIKANFPARVAFRVASMMDSRTILDRTGAQQLIGKGDMLYLQGNDPVRVQCAFVDTPEVEKIANYISEQQGYPTAFMLPEYVDPNAEPKGSAEVDMNRLDPMFEEAARLLIYHQQGSTSLIQRKFAIGYARAGRIMDQLERAGIVGPANGSKAREVLCLDENDLQMRMEGLKD